MHCIRIHATTKKTLYRAQVPAWLHDNYGKTLLLELAGPEQACRAIWATIVKKRPERTEISLDEIRLVEAGQSEYLRINPSEKYHMLPTKHGLVLLHEGFNRLNGYYLLGGDTEEPSPWFMAALYRLLPIPLLPHWAKPLWLKGLQYELVTPLRGHGVAGWKIHNYQERWTNLVSAMVKGGQLCQE